VYIIYYYCQISMRDFIFYGQSFTIEYRYSNSIFGFLNMVSTNILKPYYFCVVSTSYAYINSFEPAVKKFFQRKKNIFNILEGYLFCLHLLPMGRHSHFSYTAVLHFVCNIEYNVIAKKRR